MTLDDFLAAARTMGIAARDSVDEQILQTLRDVSHAASLSTVTPEYTTAQKYDALTNPRTAADYGVSMSADEYQAEAKRRGDKLPDWWPRSGNE